MRREHGVGSIPSTLPSMHSLDATLDEPSTSSMSLTTRAQSTPCSATLSRRIRSRCYHRIYWLRACRQDSAFDHPRCSQSGGGVAARAMLPSTRRHHYRARSSAAGLLLCVSPDHYVWCPSRDYYARSALLGLTSECSYSFRITSAE